MENMIKKGDFYFSHEFNSANKAAFAATINRVIDEFLKAGAEFKNWKSFKFECTRGFCKNDPEAEIYDVSVKRVDKNGKEFNVLVYGGFVVNWTEEGLIVKNGNPDELLYDYEYAEEGVLIANENVRQLSFVDVCDPAGITARAEQRKKEMEESANLEPELDDTDY